MEHGETEPLRARHEVRFSYRRSVGGATERFLTGLSRGEIWGSREADGRVAVPPDDGDREAGTATERFVRVGDAGVVQSWTWVASPAPDHPVGHPFAFALVQLDGADTSWFHVVDAGGEDRMATGMRVRADWRAQRTGSVLDIRAFVPESAPSSEGAAPTTPPAPVEVVTDLRLGYTYQPGRVLSRFLRGLADRKIEGGRCPSCDSVYVPPRARCPACGAGPLTPTLLGDRGTVVSVAVVRIPPPGPSPDVPFAWAWIRLDEADVPFAHLLGGAPVDDFHVGQRVEAVWADPAGRPPGWESIRHFQPADP